tara:strand:- start:1283 stop:1534 length:252 start_codon:yes stop_codon:yes gene_type:complete
MAFTVTGLNRTPSSTLVSLNTSPSSTLVNLNTSPSSTLVNLNTSPSFTLIGLPRTITWLVKGFWSGYNVETWENTTFIWDEGE